MDSSWFRLIWSIVGYAFVCLAAYATLRNGSGWRRWGAGLLLQGLVLSIPFWLPDDAVRTRFVTSLISTLLFLRLWEATLGVPADRSALTGFGNFTTFLLGPADVRFNAAGRDQESARWAGLKRLARAGVKGLGLLGLLAGFASWPALLETPVVSALWCLLAAYCAATGTADAVTGATMLLSGHSLAEVFKSPLLARSPVEFWSQRWNLMFRNSAFRLLFLPLGGRKHPLRVAAVVFLFSAATHEYMVLAALQRSEGHMTAFFLAHGVVALLDLWARRRFQRRLPVGLGIAANWAWMTASAPLFFAPVLEILQVQEFIRW